MNKLIHVCGQTCKGLKKINWWVVAAGLVDLVLWVAIIGTIQTIFEAI